MDKNMLDFGWKERCMGRGFYLKGMEKKKRENGKMANKLRMFIESMFKSLLYFFIRTDNQYFLVNNSINSC